MFTELFRSGLTTVVLPLITSDQDLIAPGSLYAGVLAIAIPGRVLFSQVSFSNQIEQIRFFLGIVF